MCVILSVFYLYSQFTYRVLSSSFHECISIQLSFLVLLFWSLFGVTKVCMWRCKLCCRDQLMRFYHSFTTQISNSKWFEGENVLSKHGHLNKNEQTANKFSASLFFFSSRVHFLFFRNFVQVCCYFYATPITLEFFGCCVKGADEEKKSIENRTLGNKFDFSVNQHATPRSLVILIFFLFIYSVLFSLSFKSKWYFFCYHGVHLSDQCDYIVDLNSVYPRFFLFPL